MAMYESFAAVYDEFMDNVPYDDWERKITGILRSHGISDGLVLDLGCGTGNMTERLASDGYDLIGVDSSVDMLQIAQEKKLRSGHDILYLNQDMRQFELYGTVRAAVSVCDSVNYILTEKDLETVFRLVSNYLDPGGLFIFDLNTVSRYEKELGNGTIAEKRDDCSFIWYNWWDPEKKINEYDLTLFVRDRGNMYRRYDEVHYERGYEISEISHLLEQAGLVMEDVRDTETWEKPAAGSGRVTFIARENKKQG